MSVRIGIDLGGTKIEVIALDDSGAARFRRRVPTPRHDYDATVKTIVDLVREAERHAGGQATVGVGVPGAISPATNRIKNANSVWLNGRLLQEDLAQALGRPVRLANDANCFALSEATDGAGAGHSVVFGVILGTGTGGGVVVDGRILVGPNAIAGEWGHNPLPWPQPDELPGERCYCGLNGCIETFLSGGGLERTYSRLPAEAGSHANDRPAEAGSHANDRPAEAGSLGDAGTHNGNAWLPPSGGRLTAGQIADAATRGDEAATRAIEIYCARLARALASIINVLDPDAIVLGGGLSNIKTLYTRVPALWDRWIFSDTVSTPLLQAVHGDSSGVRGAAWLWGR